MGITHKWIATQDEAFDETTAWSAGTAPGAGSEVYYPENAYNSTGATVAATLDKLITDRKYTGNIGANGSPVVSRATKFLHRGSGQLWWNASSTQALTVIDAGSPSTVVNLVGGTYSRLYLLRGTISVGGTVGQLVVGQHTSPNDVTCVIESAAVVTNIDQSSGFVRSNSTSAHTTWDISGGSAIRNTGNAITNLTISGSGIMVYRSSSTLANVDVHNGGTLDLRDVLDALTITTAHYLPGARVLEVVDTDLITYTTLNDFRVELT